MLVIDEILKIPLVTDLYRNVTINLILNLYFRYILF